MWWQKLLGTIFPKLFDVIDQAVLDKDQAAKLKYELQQALINVDTKIIESSTSIIIAEAGGESWFQRVWRPLLMLFFAFLMGLHWIGLTPENLDIAIQLELLSIIKIGIGGYIGVRSVEKIATTISDATVATKNHRPMDQPKYDPTKNHRPMDQPKYDLP